MARRKDDEMIELEKVESKRIDRLLYSVSPEWKLCIRGEGATKELFTNPETNKTEMRASRQLILLFTPTVIPAEVPLTDPFGRTQGVGMANMQVGQANFDSYIDFANRNGLADISDMERESMWAELTATTVHGFTTEFGFLYGTLDMIRKLGGMPRFAQTTPITEVRGSEMVA